MKLTTYTQWGSAGNDQPQVQPAPVKSTRDFVAERAALRQSLACARLSYVDLSRLHAVGVDFTLAILFGSDCTASNFSHSYMTGIDFRNAKLVNVRFDHADVRGADFTGADITGASFNGTVYDGTTRWPSGVAAPFGTVLYRY